MTKPAEPLDMLFANSLDGILLVSPTGQVLRANTAAQAILTASEAELTGRLIGQFLPDLEVNAARPQNSVETDMVSARDDRFPAEVSVFGTSNGTGMSSAWVVFRDVSARKGLEGSVRAHAQMLEGLVTARTRELEELRRRYHRLYDQVPVLDFELDSQLMVASANRKACVSLGVTSDRLVGLPLAELATPDRRETLIDALTGMTQGSSTPFETRLRAADGSIIDVILHACRNDDTPRSGVRIVGLDVTARREAERLVDQSLDLAEAQRARMERILRGIGEGVVVTDPDGQVRLMNSIAEQFLAIDERFAFGRDLFSEQRDMEFVRVWRDFTTSDEDLAAAELRVVAKGSREFAVTMSRIRTPEGRPAGCVAVLRDVTRERQLDRMKTDFVSNLTHELRTPLASIRGFTATVLRGGQVEEGDKVRFLEIVEKEAERLQSLIEDLLTLSRLEGGKDVLNLRPCDLTTVLAESRDAFTSVATSRGVMLAVTGLEANGAGVFDPQKVRRVIDNLVGNALKFTPLGGRVDVNFERDGDRLRCSIRDTGSGIEAEAVDKIFDRFYTTNRSGGNPEGTGLGLHIVKRLVELHGGEIEAESSIGEGTTFRFWIPSVPRVASRKEPEPAPVPDPLRDEEDETPPAAPEALGDLGALRDDSGVGFGPDEEPALGLGAGDEAAPPDETEWGV